jgi:HAE1 family hydrophobic/amphiphilic exporter-1
MLIAAIVVFGVVLYMRLTVDMYPEVNFPVVTVTTLYPGASPDTIETQVTDPIEEAVNSLSGIRTLRSTSLEGVSQVIAEFELDVDAATAAQDVRDQVASVQEKMPEGAKTPTIAKIDLGAAPILQLAVSGTASPTELTNYAEEKLKPALERVRGVGQIEVIGGRERELHVWIRPESLLSYSLTVHDVLQALRAQNMELPGGRFQSAGRELVVRTDARARTPLELGELALASQAGGVVRLRDVASIEDSFEEERSLARVDGRVAIAVVIRKQSDANTVTVAAAVRAALPELTKSAPAGTRIDVLVDNSVSIRASIETVELDLVLGAGLAIAIIFLFLRDPRATLISALALPTSVIGTFGFVKAMGFTLNLMTTLALSLSIGILIDDAIVVIENIVRRRSALGEAPMEAAERGTSEIGLAVFATTLSIVAVFVPVAFMEGLLGQFFFEFGLTVAFAVLLSLFVSFTLTPMLSARFLRSHHGQPRGLSGLIEAVLLRIEHGYRRIIGIALTHRALTLAGAVVALIATLALVPRLGFEFLPIEDNGQFKLKLELPPGTPLVETTERVEAITARLREIPGFRSTFTTVGGGVQEKVNAAEVVVTLSEHAERDFHLTEAMGYVRRLLAGEPNLVVAAEPLSTLNAGGTRNAPVQLILRGDNFADLESSADRIAAALRERSGFVDVDTSYRAGKPELRFEIDRNRAADVGVTGAQIATTVRALVAGEVATQFESHGDRYDVRVQLPVEYRAARSDRVPVEVRTSAGQLVDLMTVARFDRRSGPSQFDRLGRQRQVTVYAALEGVALGDALRTVTEIASRELPAAVNFEFGGTGKLLGESMASMLLALFLAVVCIYMILAAQFESFFHPFTIMVSLPFALIGAFGGLLVMQMHVSIFAMIGLIMLMGLVTKNAILLIDFALQRRAQGDGVREAVVTAGATRLRPILMTTAAMILGMLPVAIGHGQGGELRAPMGVCVIGGLITSTVLTLVVVPVIYTLVEAGLARIRRLTSGRAVATTSTDPGVVSR